MVTDDGPSQRYRSPMVPRYPYPKRRPIIRNLLWTLEVNSSASRKSDVQHYVAVYVAEDVVTRYLVGTLENIAEILGSIIVATDLRFVPNPELMTDLTSSILIAEEDHFYVWMQKCPAL